MRYNSSVGVVNIVNALYNQWQYLTIGGNSTTYDGSDVTNAIATVSQTSVDVGADYFERTLTVPYTTVVGETINKIFDSTNNSGTSSGSEKAWYKLDETSGTTALDSSGNGYNGTSTGVTVNQIGKINKAYKFTTGTTSHVATPSDWGIGAFALAVRRDLGEIEVYTGSSWGIIATGNTINTNTWYYYVVVSDATTNTTKLYFNNSLIATYTSAINGQTFSTCAWAYSTASTTSDKQRILNRESSTQLNIGDHPTVTAKTWDGLIDDVRIYDFALSESDISFLYNSGSGTDSCLSESINTSVDSYETISDITKTNLQKIIIKVKTEIIR